MHARGARGADSLERSAVDALDLLGIQLGEGSRRVKGKREGTGERTDADPDDEDDDHDEGLDRSQAVEQGPGSEVHREPDILRLPLEGSSCEEHSQQAADRSRDQDRQRVVIEVAEPRDDRSDRSSNRQARNGGSNERDPIHGRSREVRPEDVSEPARSQRKTARRQGRGNDGDEDPDDLTKG